MKKALWGPGSIPWKDKTTVLLWHVLSSARPKGSYTFQIGKGYPKGERVSRKSRREEFDILRLDPSPNISAEVREINTAT